MARDRSKNREETQAMEPRQGGQPSRTEGSPTMGPFSMMRRFADDVDRMFDRMFEGSGLSSRRHLIPWGSLRGSEFSPQVDIFERDGKLIIRADLPGLSKDDVRVDITDDAVVLEGERKSEHEEREEGVYRSERSYGQFRRQIPLPEGVKTESATATFKNGVLEVTLEAPQVNKNRRRIEVQGEGGGEKSAA